MLLTCLRKCGHFRFLHVWRVGMDEGKCATSPAPFSATHWLMMLVCRWLFFCAEMARVQRAVDKIPFVNERAELEAVLDWNANALRHRFPQLRSAIAPDIPPLATSHGDFHLAMI